MGALVSAAATAIVFFATVRTRRRPARRGSNLPIPPATVRIETQRRVRATFGDDWIR